ncbi:MAG TPA: V-type ATP synthase subunit D [Sphaerochaeta sp.]|jgi:V/A-type H+-transporting ATPase subunit D|nr:MAG: ATPase [Spirochaetes bacterium GWC2_52_13]PKL11829.1 MAG: V-type ATP synthase subunit D [Spirochaetae bacterium HGW-Spirochaetae-8]PKL19764.1 MAG: V-type ATP synthase subunit D [Spirochaetae bacterium HGW-Spirochaetae-4]HCG64915.1 V-type ATP synthase subunit D [Sphaerochaeta sp.]HCJ94152.1 V-type ATP synthase subunit D [Sphaerochaeta sp.]
MARNVAPTRSNLLKLTDELKFATLGHELLDQKRSILVVELLTLVDQAVEYQRRVDKALANAADSMQHTVMEMGRLRVANLFGAVTIDSSIELSDRKVMGVRLPRVETTFVENGPYFSPEGTTLSVEDTLSAYQEALRLMGRLAELKVSIMRLAREVKKTIRKVNALEKIVIPELHETLAYTRGRIEEAERESFMLMKQVKERLERQRKRAAEAQQ